MNAIAPIIGKIQEAAKGLGLTVLPVTVKTVDEIESAFSSMAKRKAEALIVIADFVTIVNRVRIAELAAEARLPAIYQYLAQVEAAVFSATGPTLMISTRLSQATSTGF